jgi:hypothetical protein
MDPTVRLVVALLATWRLAAALYYEGGEDPFGLVMRLRVLAQRRSPYWQEQLSCFWCCATWAALLVWPAYVWAAWVLVPLALSGGVMLLTHGGRFIATDMKQGE